ncbi:hypothetical protein HY041_02140 [Candidatus Roizmanbacteria bacterium]|nr:hypothetical protein [Candidatus Roizmanbacteria bacterium]
MEKSQRRILYPPVRIDSLITKFDTVGKRKKGELAQEIVRHSTEETFDWLATLKALNTGLSACLSNYKEFGRIIIDGVEQFLDTRGVCFKYLIPPNISSEQAKSQLKHLINDTVTKFQRFAAARPLSSHPHNVEQLIALLRYVEENHQVENEDTQRDIHRTVIDFVANNKALKAIHGEDTYSAAKKPYNLIFKAMGEYEGATEGGKVMKGPETVLTKAQSQVNIKGIPHILTSKFNGVSLEDIANVDLQTTDQLDQLCYMAMKYMAGIPKGDLFWESLISTIFVVPQMSRLDIDAKTFFSNIDFTGRIFLIQQRMAEWLLMPAVSDEITRNEQFDREFAGMISQLSIIQRHNLGGIIRIACLRGPITVCMMDPNVTLERAVHLHSLSNMALQWVEKRDPHTKIVGADKVMHDFLRDSREGISQSWKARFFSAIDVLTNLEEGFELRLDEEYESATGHTNEFIQDMKLWLGGGFIDNIELSL